MAKKTTTGLVGARPPASRRSFYAPASQSNVTNVDGTVTSLTSIQLADIDLPDRSYVANVGAVELHSGDDFLTLVFAQRDFSGKSLRSAVGVKFFPEGIRTFLGSCTNFLPKLEAIATANRINTPELASLEEEPEQSVLLVGSAMLAAFTGREAELSVYHLSPMRLHRQKADGMVAIDPVVRIQLPTGLMLAIIRRLRALEPELPANVEFKNA